VLQNILLRTDRLAIYGADLTRSILIHGKEFVLADTRTARPIDVVIIVSGDTIIAWLEVQIERGNHMEQVSSAPS